MSRHLLGLETLPAAEIRALIAAARRHAEWLRDPAAKGTSLRGRFIVLGFFESSTRTRVSFEAAGKRLGAATVAITATGSSIDKGESLLDTAWTFESMGASCLVMRHSRSGSPHDLAEKLTTMAVVNGGDGRREHPTQALLDLFSIVSHGLEPSDLRLTMVGDVAHSRVARSNIYALTALGATLTLCGPPTLMPAGIEQLGRAPGRVIVNHRLDEALAGAQAVMVLRLQRERMQEGLLPSLGEYARLYQVTPERLARQAPEALVMHPGPMNRGVEIDSRAADGSRSVIREQVTAGVAVRCAVLERACGVEEWAASGGEAAAANRAARALEEVRR
jgi:aspartate carbamoyltransferase catalytic subunit